MNVPAFLIRLLDPGRLSARIKMGPEDRICLEFAARLRMATFEGRLTAVWTHVGNELGGGRGKSSQIRYALAKHLGCITGAPDYFFLAPGGAGVIEFKAAKGVLSPNQEDFQHWCERQQIRHAVCRSADAGEAALRLWGFLR